MLPELRRQTRQTGIIIPSLREAAAERCSPAEGRGEVNASCGHINATHSLSHLSPAAQAPGSRLRPSTFPVPQAASPKALLFTPQPMVLNVVGMKDGRGVVRSDHPLHPRCGAGAGGSLGVQRQHRREVTAERYQWGVRPCRQWHPLDHEDEVLHPKASAC